VADKSITSIAELIAYSLPVKGPVCEGQKPFLEVKNPLAKVNCLFGWVEGY
jgi:hypothetical protein